jgi:hypothetical protein
LISDRQERPLGFRERWSLRLHLMMCVYCRRFARQVATISQALRKLGRQAEENAEGSELPLGARERIRKALAERRNHEH